MNLLVRGVREPVRCARVVRRTWSRFGRLIDRGVTSHRATILPLYGRGRNTSLLRERPRFLRARFRNLSVAALIRRLSRPSTLIHPEYFWQVRASLRSSCIALIRRFPRAISPTAIYSDALNSRKLSQRTMDRVSFPSLFESLTRMT